jgi:hypothetical protein
VIPFLVAVAVVELVLNSPMENVWVSVFPFFAEPAGYSFDAIFQSREILQRLEGAWWFFALFLIQAAFNTFLGEEFLFRGVLLPKMEGVFGRWSWVANSILFGLYHVYQPWGYQTLFSPVFCTLSPPIATGARGCPSSSTLLRACTSPSWYSGSCWGWLRISENSAKAKVAESTFWALT